VSVELAECTSVPYIVLTAAVVSFSLSVVGRKLIGLVTCHTRLVSFKDVGRRKFTGETVAHPGKILPMGDEQRVFLIYDAYMPGARLELPVVQLTTPNMLFISCKCPYPEKIQYSPTVQSLS
jgi:hypothetical protein